MKVWPRGGVVLAAVTLLAGGCAASKYGVAGSEPTSGPGGGAPRASGTVVAVGHGWTSSRLDGSIPAAGSCHIRWATDGEPLPDPVCTPGAVDAAVNNGDIAGTVCRKGGYTSSVRPPVSLTEPAKRSLLAAYGIPESQIGKYELDHLVDLAAGGASDVRNLWPEPNTFSQFHSSGFVHNDKDAVESYTYHAICGHKVTVTAVQKAIATDWTTAVAKLGLSPMTATYQG
jgi:hypothetical protein